jgi:SM-20-related protein
MTAIADSLRDNGWALCPDYFDADFTAALRDDLLSCGQSLTKAAIGRGGARRQITDIRNDSIHWLDGAAAAQTRFLERMENLRRELNRALFLGLFEYEAHYARYEPGGFYKKHVDSLKGTRNRIVSTVTYLTPDWTEADGGHLVLYAPDEEDRALTKILPRPGALALFMSEEIPHEVLPPARTRESVAGWFRCNSVSEKRMDAL